MNALRPALSSLPLALTLALSGCTIAGDYRIADGARMSRSYRSIAGSVEIGRNATVREARTVAGDIEVKDGAATRSLESVAGDIRIGEAVKIDGDISTVAGDIRIGPRAHVTGQVKTIAGEIRLTDCRVEGPVHTSTGSLKTHGTTRLPGGLVVHYKKLGEHDDMPKIDIGPGAEVASIEVQPQAEVDLRISHEARVGKVTGATPTTY